MADGVDGFEEDDEDRRGSGFLAGLLTGTVLGSGLAMLFAPKAGVEVRGESADQVGAASTPTPEDRKAGDGVRPDETA